MRKSWFAVVLFSMVLSIAVAQEDAVALKVVKYDGLKEEVVRQRGKVVVVDFWQDTCLPCKRNMPGLLKLARDYAAKGLAVVTVSVDDLQADPEVKDRLLKFLKKQNAVVPNLLLDEPRSVWEPKLRFRTVPTVFVFDRKGQWVQFTDDVDPEKVHEMVLSLLNE